MAEFKLLFKNKVTEEEALAPLEKAVKTGKVGSLSVDPESLKIVKNTEGKGDNKKCKEPVEYYCLGIQEKR